MHRKRFGVLLLALLAGPALGAPSHHVACGAVLATPGNYHLSEDLFCPLGLPPPSVCDSAAITITSPKVHLNGRGFTVSGRQTGVGLRIATTRAHVHGIALESFDIGIEITGGGSHRLNGVAARRNSDFHCGNGVGVAMTETAGNDLVGSDVSRNERWGVRLVSSDDNRLIGNLITRNRFRPGAESGNVDLSSSHDNRVQGNDLSEGGIFGIRLLDSDANSIAANRIDETGTQAGFGSAIFLTGSVGSSIQANRIDREPPGPTVGFIGIHLFEGSLRNLVRSNRVFDHTAGGIVVAQGAVENVLRGNRALDNTPWDASDDNADCDDNTWDGNQFGMVSQPCIE